MPLRLPTTTAWPRSLAFTPASQNSSALMPRLVELMRVRLPMCMARAAPEGAGQSAIAPGTLAAIGKLAANSTDLPFAAEVEAYAREALRKKKPDHPLDTNVEFFTAILLVMPGGPQGR